MIVKYDRVSEELNVLPESRLRISAVILSIVIRDVIIVSRF